MPSDNGLFEAKVQSYLDGLSPEARRMIMRRLGRPEEAAETQPAAEPDPAPKPDPALRRTFRPTREMIDARAVLFAPYEPFVIHDPLPNRQTGWLRRSTFDGLWTYLLREALPERIGPWEQPVEMTPEAAEETRRRTLPALSDAAFAMLEAIEKAGREDSRLQQKFASRIGGDVALADLRDMLALRPRLRRIEGGLARLPAVIQAADAAEKSAAAGIRTHLASHADDAVFLAAAVALRAVSGGSLARIAGHIVGSSEVADLRRSPSAALVDVALSAAERHVVRFSTLLSGGGSTEELVAEVKGFHDVVRGMTHAFNVEDDRLWHARLAALRTAISDPLAGAVEGVVPAIRLALGADRWATPADEDRADALRAAALFAAARRYRDALAVNAPVTRLWPVVDQALQVYGRGAVDRLRAATGTERQQLEAATAMAVELAELVHGTDYATLLRRARDAALKP